MNKDSTALFSEASWRLVLAWYRKKRNESSL